MEDLATTIQVNHHEIIRDLYMNRKLIREYLKKALFEMPDKKVIFDPDVCMPHAIYQACATICLYGDEWHREYVESVGIEDDTLTIYTDSGAKITDIDLDYNDLYDIWVMVDEILTLNE